MSSLLHGSEDVFETEEKDRTQKFALSFLTK